MKNDLRLRFVIVGDEIFVEFQANSTKLAPSIRVKSFIKTPNLSLLERELLFFLKQIGGENPPFIIKKEHLSSELCKKILDLNFLFIKNRYGSLKRINTLPFNKSLNDDIYFIKPTNLKFYINKFTKNGACVETFLEFDNIEVPLWYNFLIFKDDCLYKIDKDSLVDFANSLIEDVFATNFTFEELNLLSEHFIVLMKYEKQNTKSVSFSRLSSGLLSFGKDFDYDTNYYTKLLEAYLANKNYVEFDQKILVFDKDSISKRDVLTIVKNAIDNTNIATYDILKFLDKIENLQKFDMSKENLILQQNIKKPLKDYQTEGVLWLCNLYKNKAFGGLLADDMGLGKTLQTICFLVASGVKKTLIVVPASLVINWKNEILKFTNVKESDISTNLNLAKIQILSYESVRANIDKICGYDIFDVLVLDESQKIKNDKTQIYNAIMQIKRDFTAVLTGTPIENSLLDLWNIMSAINPHFRWLYNEKISRFSGDISATIDLSLKFLAPFIKRRQKELVLNLPTRKIETIFIDFSDKEKDIYDKIYDTFHSALNSGMSGRANFVLLEGLLRLRQFCSLHRIVPKNLSNCKQLHDSKLELTLNLVDKITSKNEKVIIFSQFTQSLEVLKAALSETKYLYLDGAVTKTQRAKIVAEFSKKDSDFKVFLISLKAGGVGLNLTSASHAIMLEPWFNPAVEEQAFSRIHRIGQERETFVYRLLYANSIETQIERLIFSKLDISQGLNNGLLEMAKKIFIY